MPFQILLQKLKTQFPPKHGSACSIRYGMTTPNLYLMPFALLVVI